MNFDMNHSPGAGSIARPVDQPSTVPRTPIVFILYGLACELRFERFRFVSFEMLSCMLEDSVHFSKYDVYPIMMPVL